MNRTWQPSGRRSKISTEIISGEYMPTFGPRSARPPTPEEDPAQQAEERVQYRALLAQVGQLPDRQRDAISLRHSGLSFDEVGRLLGCSEDAAKMLYHRALKALREAVQKEGA